MFGFSRNRVGSSRHSENPRKRGSDRQSQQEPVINGGPMTRLQRGKSRETGLRM